MENLSWKKKFSRLVRRWKNGSAITKIFEKNRNRKKRKSKEEKTRMGTEKWL